MALTFTIYCILIAIASVVGGFIPLVFRLTHLRVQIALSFVSGVLLGVGLLHMLPHALEGGVDPHRVCIAVVVGFMTIFILERFFSFHHHDFDDSDVPEDEHSIEPASTHGHHSLSWVGTLFGMTIHTLVAGVALASATVASFTLTSEPTDALITFAGFGTFLGIFLHKPFDALTITTLMRAGASSRWKTMLVNLLFALVIPAGVGLFFLLEGLGEWNHLASYALAFSAGTFLCIGGSDLLPELQFHKHNRLTLTVALILGFVLAWASGLLEHHDHDHDHGGHAGHGHSSSVVDVHDHGHDHGHDHDHAHDHDHPHPH